MSKPKGIQPPPYTQVPNLLFDDHLPDMGLAELKVTLAAIRQILGYHKKHPETISINQFVAMTGLSRQGVVDGIAAAMERGILIQAGTGARKTAKYKLNFIDDQSTSLASDQSTQWASQDAANKLDQSTHLASSGQASRPELAYSVDTQKKVVKENSKEKELTSIPKEGIEVAPPIPEPATPEPQAQPEPVPVVQEPLPFTGEPNPDIEGAPESVVAASASRDLPVADPHEVDAAIYAVGESKPEVVKEKPERIKLDWDDMLKAVMESLSSEDLKITQGAAMNYANMLWGRAKKGEFGLNNMPGEPVTPNELRYAAKWYRNRNNGEICQQAAKVTGMVMAFREWVAKRKAQPVYQDIVIPDSWRPSASDGVIPFPAKRNPTGTEGKF